MDCFDFKGNITPDSGLVTNIMPLWHKKATLCSVADGYGAIGSLLAKTKRNIRLIGRAAIHYRSMIEVK
jgi:hypothetical protein